MLGPFPAPVVRWLYLYKCTCTTQCLPVAKFNKTTWVFGRSFWPIKYIYLQLIILLCEYYEHALSIVSILLRRRRRIGEEFFYDKTSANNNAPKCRRQLTKKLINFSKRMQTRTSVLNPSFLGNYQSFRVYKSWIFLANFINTYFYARIQRK